MSPVRSRDDAVRSIKRGPRRRYSAAFRGGQGSAGPLEIGAEAMEASREELPGVRGAERIDPARRTAARRRGPHDRRRLLDRPGKVADAPRACRSWRCPTLAGSEATNVWRQAQVHRKTTGVDDRVLPKVVVHARLYRSRLRIGRQRNAPHDLPRPRRRVRTLPRRDARHRPPYATPFSAPAEPDVDARLRTVLDGRPAAAGLCARCGGSSASWTRSPSSG